MPTRATDMSLLPLVVVVPLSTSIHMLLKHAWVGCMWIYGGAMVVYGISLAFRLWWCYEHRSWLNHRHRLMPETLTSVFMAQPDKTHPTGPDRNMPFYN